MEKAAIGKEILAQYNDALEHEYNSLKKKKNENRIEIQNLAKSIGRQSQFVLTYFSFSFFEWQ